MCAAVLRRVCDLISSVHSLCADSGHQRVAGACLCVSVSSVLAREGEGESESERWVQEEIDVMVKEIDTDGNDEIDFEGELPLEVCRQCSGESVFMCRQSSLRLCPGR